MLNKKTIKNILLEVEAGYYNYERYLNDIISRILNKDKKDTRYLIARENNYLVLYKYSESDYMLWLYENYSTYEHEVDELKNNYSMIYEYVKNYYIEYYVEENITNFINISKFRNMLYKNEKGILTDTLNSIYSNIRNYSNNKYLIRECNLNKKLYHELKKIKKEVLKMTKNKNIGIELMRNSIIDAFITENVKQLELIKTCESYDIYNIKNRDMMLYISDKKDASESQIFNTHIFNNLYKVNNLSIDMIVTLFNNFIFDC